MKYAQPTVTLIGTAVNSVQATDKEFGTFLDLSLKNFTTNAYEADE